MPQSQQPASPRKKATIKYLTTVLFGLVAGGTLIGVPAFAYTYGFTWLDWTMFAVLYVVTGLGITVEVVFASSVPFFSPQMLSVQVGNLLIDLHP